MSDTTPQSVSNGCRKYVKSRIKFNTFNTFNNVDLSKIVFTGVVIGGVSPAFTDMQNVNYWFVVCGFIISLLAAIIGCRILKP